MHYLPVQQAVIREGKEQVRIKRVSSVPGDCIPDLISCLTFHKQIIYCGLCYFWLLNLRQKRESWFKTSYVAIDKCQLLTKNNPNLLSHSVELFYVNTRGTDTKRLCSTVCYYQAVATFQKKIKCLHFSNKETVLQTICEHPREPFKTPHWKSIILEQLSWVKLLEAKNKWRRAFNCINALEFSYSWFFILLQLRR